MERCVEGEKSLAVEVDTIAEVGMTAGVVFGIVRGMRSMGNEVGNRMLRSVRLLAYMLNSVSTSATAEEGGT